MSHWKQYVPVFCLHVWNSVQQVFFSMTLTEILISLGFFTRIRFDSVLVSIRLVRKISSIGGLSMLRNSVCRLTAHARHYLNRVYLAITSIKQKSIHIIIPPANFLCGGVYCFHVVRPSVTLWFFPNILKTQWWIFINFRKHFDINKVHLHKKKEGLGANSLRVIALCKISYAVKSLCAHYLFNQWLEFDQTSIDTSLGRGTEVIRFWWPWPYFQGHYIIKILKVSRVCTLSHESIDGIWPN